LSRNSINVAAACAVQCHKAAAEEEKDIKREREIEIERELMQNDDCARFFSSWFFELSYRRFNYAVAGSLKLRKTNHFDFVPEYLSLSVFSLFFSLSFSLSLSLSVFFSYLFSVSLFSPSLFTSLSLSLYSFFPLSLYLYLNLSLSLSLILFGNVSVQKS
jgi:hypothetical protein